MGGAEGPTSDGETAEEHISDVLNDSGVDFDDVVDLETTTPGTQEVVLTILPIDIRTNQIVALFLSNCKKMRDEKCMCIFFHTKYITIKNKSLSRRKSR